MIGIVLSGGNGTRLYPTTKTNSKQLHPLYDKPIIYYSLSLLIELGIKDIILITNPEYIQQYKNLLNILKFSKIKIKFIEQKYPGGIPEALILTKNIIKNKNVCLLLGDNFFYSKILLNSINSIKKQLIKKKASICAYYFKDPSSYGVLKFNKKNCVESIKEKPQKFISNYAVTGIYFYPKDVTEYLHLLKKSKRGEYEITSLNNIYISNSKINLIYLSKQCTWMDLGDHERLLDGSNFVKSLESRNNEKIGCLEQKLLEKKFIDTKTLKKIVELEYPNSKYKDYCLSLML